MTTSNNNDGGGRLLKKQVQGIRIFKRIIQRDPDEGGIFMEVTGIQGSGKTCFLHKVGQKIIERNPDEIVFWRDPYDAPIQFNRVDNWELYIQRGMHIVVENIETREQHKLPYTMFTDYDDLLTKAQPGVLNAVFFKDDLQWVDFIKHCRLSPGWQTVLIDEYEDIFPQRSRGEQWRKNEWAANNMKQVRKGLVSVIGASQSISDVDYRVRSKLMIWAYLNGAKVDQRSPVYQRAVNNLSTKGNKREAWLDWGHSIYGHIEVHAPFHPKTPKLTIRNIDIPGYQENEEAEAAIP